MTFIMAGTRKIQSPISTRLINVFCAFFISDSSEAITALAKSIAPKPITKAGTIIFGYIKISLIMYRKLAGSSLLPKIPSQVRFPL